VIDHNTVGLDGANCWAHTGNEVTGNFKCVTSTSISDAKSLASEDGKGFVITGFDAIPAGKMLSIKFLIQHPIIDTAVGLIWSTWDVYNDGNRAVN
jgi:hypothetical protein